jgi:hypothetical protein
VQTSQCSGYNNHGDGYFRHLQQQQQKHFYSNKHGLFALSLMQASNPRSLLLPTDLFQIMAVSKQWSVHF